MLQISKLLSTLIKKKAAPSLIHQTAKKVIAKTAAKDLLRLYESNKYFSRSKTVKQLFAKRLKKYTTGVLNRIAKEATQIDLTDIESLKANIESMASDPNITTEKLKDMLFRYTSKPKIMAKLNHQKLLTDMTQREKENLLNKKAQLNKRKKEKKREKKDEVEEALQTVLNMGIAQLDKFLDTVGNQMQYEQSDQEYAICIWDICKAYVANAKALFLDKNIPLKVRAAFMNELSKKNLFVNAFADIYIRAETATATAVDQTIGNIKTKIMRWTDVVNYYDAFKHYRLQILNHIMNMVTELEDYYIGGNL